MLVLDQGLAQVGFLVDDIDQVIYHTPFAAHDQVEIAQTDVKVDHRRLVPAQRQPGGKTGAGRGFADAPLARCHNDDFGHKNSPLTKLVQFRAEKGNGVISIFSPCSRTITRCCARLAGKPSSKVR